MVTDQRDSKRIATKKPWLAFLCSFVIPGAGLAYLGKPRWALVNFLTAQAILILAYLVFQSDLFDWIHYLFLALAAGSGGIAHAYADQIGADQC